jgi:predicted  nucleic acid-binding Zn-ribbon protein
MRNSNYPAALAVLIALALVASPVYAGDKEREAMRRVQIMQQQFSDEKAALQQSNDSLTQQVDTLTKQTDSIKQGTAQSERQRAALARELGAARSAQAATRAEVVALQDKLKQLEAAQAALVAQHKQEAAQDQKQIALAQQAVAQRGQALGVCEQKNLKLYQLNRDILTQYRNKGVLGALTQAEPLTGIESVRMENILQEYRDKLDAQKVGAAQ